MLQQKVTYAGQGTQSPKSLSKNIEGWDGGWGPESKALRLVLYKYILN